MTKEALQQEVKELIENHLEVKQISQNQFAEMIGISAATMTNVLKERWEKINSSMLNKIRNYFNTQEWVIIETENFLKIKETCNSSRLYKRMQVIVGYAGAGKTCALHKYYATNKNTYLVTCSRSVRNKQFLSQILRSLGISYLATDYEMTMRIIEELNKKDNPLLIIDEASKLSPNSIMCIQDIWDGIENNAGIVLAGVEYLLNNIKKGAEKKRMGMTEFHSRVFHWHELAEPKKEDVISLCKYNGLTNQKDIQRITRLSNFRLVRNAIHKLNTL